MGFKRDRTSVSRIWSAKCERQTGHIVGAAKNRREIGPQGEGRGELALVHLHRRQPADAEIGVEQFALHGVDALGQPLRPTAVTAGSVRVVDALG